MALGWRDGLGDDGSRGNTLNNSSCRGAEDGSGNWARLEKGWSCGCGKSWGNSKLRGNSNGSFVDYSADDGCCNGSGNGSVEHRGNLVGESRGSNSAGNGCLCEDWSRGSNSVGNGCWCEDGSRGSNSADNGCWCDNGSRGSGDNGVDETIFIQVFTEAFKGERPEAFGGCDSVTDNWGERASFGSLDDGSDSGLGG